MDFKYHTVWHVLITDSQKRGHSLVKHTTQSQTHNRVPHLFFSHNYLLGPCWVPQLKSPNNLHDKVKVCF